jgi:Effector Associated Constant Component 1
VTASTVIFGAAVGTPRKVAHIQYRKAMFGCLIHGRVAMRLMISSVEPDDGQALASLYRWLSQDAVVARYGGVTAHEVSREPGEMGAALDVINAVFADAGATAGVGSLLIAYRAWRDTRTKAPTFTVTMNDVTVTLDRGTEEEFKKIIDLIPKRDDATVKGHPGKQ